MALSLRDDRLSGLVTAALAGLLTLAWLWFGEGPSAQDATVVIPRGASVALAAEKLETAGVIRSARFFRMGARLAGRGKPIHAGEYALPAGISAARVLHVLQSGNVILHRITVAEGLSAVQVTDLINDEPMLEGEASVPAEGSVLPDTYSFSRGEDRQAVLERMQDAMDRLMEELWQTRSPDLPYATPQEALTMASIIEKETGKASEYRLVAGVYVNRLRQGMRLQADPTVIYPITRGKPLGRRIRRSELDAVNGYNTYTRDGLPEGPIAMPGRKALEAALDPAKTDAIFFVADGSGGHAFAATYAEHQRNVGSWRSHRARSGK